MPKVRRKRRTTKTKRLTRPTQTSASRRTRKTPEKLAAITTDEEIQEIKANYFDLVSEPNGSVKSKSTGNFIQLSKPPRNLKVPDGWDVKPGDVLSWSEGRPTETFFVTSNGTLLKNPDTSGSGYLTIPLSITSQFSDAVNHFSSVLDSVGRNYVSSIELQPTDSFFATHFSKKPLPASIINRNDISYSFDPNEEVLYVSISSKSDRSQQFPLNETKLNDIIQWISASNESMSKLIVHYNFEGKETCSKAPRGIITGLPAGWQCEQQGSLMYGDTKIQGEWKCEGPEKTKEKARKIIEKFYKGLNVEIK